MSERVLVFVYGTLRRGESAEHLMSSGTWLGQARTTSGHQLVSMGWYPAMLRTEEATSVIGEVYEISAEMLPTLDAYEDVPHLYTRERVEMGEGPVPEAMAYLLRPEHAVHRPVIAGGDWCARRMRFDE